YPIVLFIFLTTCGNLLAQRKTPNIILFIGAEISSFDLESYGNRTAHTPFSNILAKQGMLFERAYSPTSLTEPALNAILTASHPLENKVHRYGASLGPSPIKQFEAAGYRIAITSTDSRQLRSEAHTS